MKREESARFAVSSTLSLRRSIRQVSTVACVEAYRNLATFRSVVSVGPYRRFILFVPHSSISFVIR